MNLILLHQREVVAKTTITLQDRRAKHICQVIKPLVGDTLCAGIIDGGISQARVIAITTGADYSVTLDITDLTSDITPDITAEIASEIAEQPLNNQSLSQGLTASLPKKLDTTLIIALPRPKVARRLIRLSVECGIKQLIFINSYRVEKSFWQSPLLSEQKINEQIMLGLEQAKDTYWPSIEMHKRFKPFVEDRLPTIAKGKQALVAHPYQPDIDINAVQNITRQLQQCPSLIVIGPEGGFIPYEVELLQQAGLKTLGLGKRIYRVETVVPLLLGKLGL